MQNVNKIINASFVSATMPNLYIFMINPLVKILTAAGGEVVTPKIVAINHIHNQYSI